MNRQFPQVDFGQHKASMKSVNVRRDALLAKLKENREKHVADYEKSLIGYRIEVLKVLEKALEKAKGGEYDNDNLYVMEHMPENHTSEYDQVIAMMEMSVDEIITLEASEVQQYVLDQWHWKANFAATTTKYIANVR